MADLTDDLFEQEVLNASVPVLVDFWAPWCGPCKMLTPVIDELSKMNSGVIKVCKLNIDDNPKIPSSYGVRSIPTLMIFNHGKLLDTKIGLLTKEAILNWIQSVANISI